MVLDSTTSKLFWGLNETAPVQTLADSWHPEVTHVGPFTLNKFLEESFQVSCFLEKDI